MGLLMCMSGSAKAPAAAPRDMRAAVSICSPAGQSREYSFLVDASANGNDVFFISRADLVKSDVTDYDVLYDARVGGVEPVPAGCTGKRLPGHPARTPHLRHPRERDVQRHRQLPTRTTTHPTKTRNPGPEARKGPEGLQAQVPAQEDQAPSVRTRRPQDLRREGKREAGEQEGAPLMTRAHRSAGKATR